MTSHIKAWHDEYKTWKGGPYSLELLGPGHKKGRLLDAGCGGGKYSLPLRMRGFDVTAIDVSLKALKIAGDRSAGRKLDITFLAANIYTMPFRNAYFDVIWCYGVLQHLLLKERELAMIEFWRILKEGGLLFIEVFGEGDMRYGGNEIEHNTFSRKNGIIYHYFNKNELEGLLKSFSHRIIESRKEKRFDGRAYTRHTISAIAKKIIK
ncbi:Ubiquinone biosynthesis O-methyltransferase [uncultured archaeon]|nr:Ubiquinone biosynthesis O-methyltransferase [uncultured archaeon]